jgi:hypothetical protein
MTARRVGAGLAIALAVLLPGCAGVTFDPPGIAPLEEVQPPSSDAPESGAPDEAPDATEPTDTPTSEEQPEGGDVDDPDAEAIRPEDTDTTDAIPDPSTVPPGAQSLDSSGLGYTIEEFYADYNTALALTDQYWTNHFSEHVNGQYMPPALYNSSPHLGVGLYDAVANERGEITTAGDLVVCGPTYLLDNNAHYCGPPFTDDAHYVAFDIDMTLRSFEQGDTFLYFLVAHEWAHAIQAQVAEVSRDQMYELQADCIAGGTLQGMLDDGTLLFEAGDNDEVARTLTSLGDSLPWTKPGDHGTAEQRIAAYNQGVTSGVNSCWVPAA